MELKDLNQKGFTQFLHLKISQLEKERDQYLEVIRRTLRVIKATNIHTRLKEMDWAFLEEIE